VHLYAYYGDSDSNRKSDSDGDGVAHQIKKVIQARLFHDGEVDSIAHE
jgi:hypothetical protein